VGHALVRLQVDRALRRVRALERVLELPLGHGALANGDLAPPAQAHDEPLVHVEPVRRDLRQVDLEPALEERRRDHEDDEQHEQDVDERRDVDLGHRAIATLELHERRAPSLWSTYSLVNCWARWPVSRSLPWQWL